MAKKRATYLKGLGDLFIKASRVDNPALQLDDAESVTPWAGVATGTVALSQVQLLEGNYSIYVNVASANDGAEYVPTDGDLSAHENTILLANIYSNGPATISVRINDTTNYDEWDYAVVAGWNRVLIDLSSTPDDNSGTVDWETVDGVQFTTSTTDDFYVDGIYFFDTLGDVARDENIRIGCINEIGLETSDETIELRCSRNEVVETEITSTEITLSAAVRDFDPYGIALLSAGEVTTTGVTKLEEGEEFTVPATPFQYTLDKAATLKIGDGYGVWIRKAETGEVLQETPDSTIIPAGYYYVNPSTGVITFNSNEQGIAMIADYNVTVPQGRVMEVMADRNFLEFSLQFQVKGSNGKTALLFFPRIKSSSFSMTPNLEDFWQWDFEGTVLASPAGKYYDFHVAD